MSTHLSRTAGQWNRRHRHICWVRCSAHRSGSRFRTQLQETKKENDSLNKDRPFIMLQMTSPFNYLHHLHIRINTYFIVYLDNKHVRVFTDDISSQANDTNSLHFILHLQHCSNPNNNLNENLEQLKYLWFDHLFGFCSKYTMFLALSIQCTWF